MKFEQAYKKFHTLQEKIAYEGISLRITEVRQMLDSGLALLSEALAERETANTNSMLPEKLSPRAEVWMRSWQSICQADKGPLYSTSHADQCLRDFDQRFPEYKGKDDGGS